MVRRSGLLKGSTQQLATLTRSTVRGREMSRSTYRPSPSKCGRESEQRPVSVSHAPMSEIECHCSTSWGSTALRPTCWTNTARISSTPVADGDKIACTPRP